MENAEINMPAAEQVSHEIYDVAIIGAGPAGAVCAIHLAGFGKKVLLIDKCEFPREKICGDGIIADSLNALERAGLGSRVREKGYAVKKGKIFSPSRIELPVPGDYLTLKREKLDAIIVRRAVEAGAVLCKGKIKNIDINSDGTTTCVTQDGIRINSRAAVVATGVLIDLLEKHDMIIDRRPSAVAVRCYVKSSKIMDEMVISYDRSILPGYSWIFPMGGGEYNCGCGVHIGYTKNKRPKLKDMFDIFCGSFPIMKSLMAGMTEQTELRSAPLRCGLTGGKSAGATGNLLAVGEATGTTFPFTGEGIGKAMESGELAAKILNQAFNTSDFSALRNFGAVLKENLENKYTGYRIAERWISYPWLNDFMIKRINRSEYLHAAMTGIINETVDPRTIFSVKGIIQSLFK